MKSEKKGKSLRDHAEELRKEFHSVVETCDVRVTRDISVVVCIATHRDMPGREYTVSFNVTKLVKAKDGTPVKRSLDEYHVMRHFSDYEDDNREFMEMQTRALTEARKLKNEIENEEELQ